MSCVGNENPSQEQEQRVCVYELKKEGVMIMAM